MTPILQGRQWPALAGLLCCLLACTENRAAEPRHLLQQFPRTQIIIVTTRNCLHFEIYVANTREQRAQGLMHIRSMRLHEGMLFAYKEPLRISMWMKNTLIPLDMLFFDTTLQIKSIHANAVPLSTEVIDSGDVVAGVIELNGGAAKKLGIEAGNTLLVFNRQPN